MATEDRTSEFLALAQELEASGLGSGSGSGSAGSATGTSTAIGGGKPQPPYPMSRAPTGIHDNTSTGAGAGANSSKMRGRYGASDTATNSNDPSDPANELRKFHQTATTISQDIATTSAMLQELTSLVRRRNLFVDDSDRINWLVLRIKTSIQSLDGRLDEAAAVIARNKRRLGRNSQRGEEMNNLGQTLKENYEEIGLGFKSLLEERSVRMKDDAERRRAVNAGDAYAGGHEGGGGHSHSAALNSRPLVYGDSGADGGSSHLQNRDRDALPGRSGSGGVGIGGGGNSFLGGGGGGGGGNALGGGGSVGPMLDLTSAVRMSSTGGAGNTNVQGAGEPSGSGSGSGSNEYLPRPHGELLFNWVLF